MAGTGAGSVVPPSEDAVWRQLRELKAQVESAVATAASAQAVAASLGTVLANQVTGGVGSAANNNFPLTGSYATYASFNLTVPSGFTRAVISASGFMDATTNASSGDNLFARVLVAGAAGQESPGITYTGTRNATLAAFTAASLTGLSGGQNILVEIQGRYTNGPADTVFRSFAVANVTAVALYLK